MLRAPEDGGVPLHGEAEDMDGVVTLRRAVVAALVRNPELAAFASEVRVREARALGASLLPNPELRVEIENVAGSGSRRELEDTESTLRLSQLIELGSKRAKRVRVEELGRELAGWDYESKRLSVLTDVTKAFVAALAAQERRELAAELERVAAEAVRAVKTQVGAGASSPLEVTRAHVALGRAQVAHVEARRELAAARSVLAATWGGRSPRFSRVSGDLTVVPEPPSDEDLLPCLGHNPDLARWATEIDERAAALTLEEAGRVPNVTVGAGGRHFDDNGDDALVFELALPLPVFNRNQGAIREAEHRLSKGRAEREAAEVSVRAALAAALERLRAAHDRATALKDRILPQAEMASAGVLDAYKKGLFRYVDVLDAQRTLFELRSEYLGALEAFHMASADVERLTGTPLEAVARGGGQP